MSTVPLRVILPFKNNESFFWIFPKVFEFKAGLEKEYGPINIDIESGKYTVIEENKE